MALIATRDDRTFYTNEDVYISQFGFENIGDEDFPQIDETAVNYVDLGCHQVKAEFFKYKSKKKVKVRYRAAHIKFAANIIRYNVGFIQIPTVERVIGYVSVLSPGCRYLFKLRGPPAV